MNYNCEFIDRCADILMLRTGQRQGLINKDLINQYENLCSIKKITQGPCKLYDEYKKEIKE